MSIGFIEIYEKGATVAELMQRPPDEWLQPKNRHPFETVGFLGGKTVVRCEQSKGEWHAPLDARSISSDRLNSYLKAQLADAKRHWERNFQLSYQTKGWRGLKKKVGGYLGIDFPIPLPSPNPSFADLVSVQKTSTGELVATQEMERKEIELKRQISLLETQNAGNPPESEHWQSLKLTWDDLLKACEARHLSQKQTLAKTQKDERDGIASQWKAVSVQQRETLLLAHLFVLRVLVDFPKKIKRGLISVLEGDPLDSDEALLATFYRRYDVILQAIGALNDETTQTARQTTPDSTTRLA